MHIPEEMMSKLQQAQRVVVFTGAGVSAESNIPTFRDHLTGLWENFDAKDLASPRAFRQDAALVWGWYEWRRMKIMQAQPNSAHLAIATLAKLVSELTVITQNIDDLHERAGSDGVLHLHGRINSPVCFRCRRPYEYPAGIPNEPEGGRQLEPPRCKTCNSKIRPGAVWFGESLPATEWSKAKKAVKNCEVFFCIGTSLIVQPAAQLVQLAIKHGALVIQINPNTTAQDNSINLNLHGPAGEVLPWLINQVPTWQKQ